MTQEPNKFCIFSTQRSGSTWLCSLLDSHPNVRVLPGELFLSREQEEKWIDPDFIPFFDFRKSTDKSRPRVTFQYLDNLSDYPKKVGSIGFKLMYNHLFRYPEILFKLVFDKYKIIHIYRDNYLDVILSRTYSNELKLDHVTQKVPIPPKVKLDTSKLIDQLRWREININLACLFLTFISNSVINVKYQDLCNDRDETLDRITKFIGVPDCSSFHSKLQKINTGSYIEKIENFAEVKQALKGTRYEKFLIENGSHSSPQVEDTWTTYLHTVVKLAAEFFRNLCHESVKSKVS